MAIFRYHFHVHGTYERLKMEYQAMETNVEQVSHCFTSVMGPKNKKESTCNVGVNNYKGNNNNENALHGSVFRPSTYLQVISGWGRSQRLIRA